MVPQALSRSIASAVLAYILLHGCASLPTRPSQAEDAPPGATAPPDTPVPDPATSDSDSAAARNRSGAPAGSPPAESRAAERLIAGFSALTALGSGVVAGLVYWLQRKRDEEAWYKEFRELHREFWSDDESLRFSRRCISNDLAYDELRAVLEKRLDQGDKCRLSEAEYKMLDDIDRFCSVLVRVKDINPGRLTEAQQRLWDRAYYVYWFNRIESGRRPELQRYINLVWPDVVAPYRGVHARSTDGT
jgi:hypothetical protein